MDALPWHVQARIDEDFARSVDLERKWAALSLPEPARFLNAGRHRAVLRVGPDVVKVPRNAAGLEANKREAFYCEAARPYDGWDGPVRYPECHLESPFLVMEYVFPVRPEELPAHGWWDRLPDGPQVGYNNRDQLVAYDFGD